jgi:hypothetical protein
VEEQYLIWRVWYEKGTPLAELRNKWTYEDLLHANAVLDMYADMNMAQDGLLEYQRKEKERSV